MKPLDVDDAGWSNLARKAAAGHSASQKQLLVYLLPRVRNLVRYLVRGDPEVDDLSQEALLLIFRGLATYRGEGAFRSWADRIVARSVFASRKDPARRMEQAAIALDVAAEPSALPDQYYLRRQVVAELDQLPMQQRDVLVLHYVLGMTIPEIAEELGVPDETVRSRIRLGKERLRNQMADEAKPVAR